MYSNDISSTAVLISTYLYSKEIELCQTIDYDLEYKINDLDLRLRSVFTYIDKIAIT